MTLLTMSQQQMFEAASKEERQRQESSPELRRWGALLLWLLLIWAFIFLFAPWLQSRSTAVRTLSDYIEASGIDAGAVYYTEVEEVGDADLMIRDTFRFFLPGRKKANSN